MHAQTHPFMETPVSNDAAQAISGDWSAFQTVLQAALVARGRQGLALWLEGGIQDFLPHHALIAAWGDFRTGDLAYDVITANPALALDALPADVMEPLVHAMHGRWLTAGQEPVSIDTRGLRSIGCALFSFSPCALVHGVRDHRSRYDCIYIFVGPATLADALPRQQCSVALPYIDIAFRQLPDRAGQGGGFRPAQAGFPGTECVWGPHLRGPDDDTIAGALRRDAVEPDGFAGRASSLSARELEVMKWVRAGKTNPEIAMILHLSMFTVKNHMRRIYRKLDVLNRAQAVGSLDGMRDAPQRAAVQRPAPARAPSNRSRAPSDAHPQAAR